MIATRLDAVAEIYVKIALSLGQHVPGYVDAYYGPPEWRTQIAARPLDPAQIRKRCDSLLLELEAPVQSGADVLVVLRQRYLQTQLRAAAAQLSLFEGRKMTFDEESLALYDTVAPTLPPEHFERLRDELAPLLPGSGSLVERYEAYKDRFIIPADRLDAVFRAAIDACRERTLRHIELPPGESFDLEYVKDKPWSGYNWYQGGYRSLIQINTDLPIHIDRAIDLACHEGYPGHHVYNTLLEQHLVRDRGWVEFSVYPLFSPQSLISEGTANHGIEMAFPEDERLEFERQTLFPLAGLDPDEAERYQRVRQRVDKLGAAEIATARRYLDGQIDARTAVEELTRYGLKTPARAAQRVRFFDTYRSYVINYHVGQDLVRAYIEARSEGDGTRAWEAFAQLLSSPRLPSGLRESQRGGSGGE